MQEEKAAPAKIAIRGLDPDLWREVRSYAVRLNMPAGELLNDIMGWWLEEVGAGRLLPPEKREKRKS